VLNTLFELQIGQPSTPNLPLDSINPREARKTSLSMTQGCAGACFRVRQGQSAHQQHSQGTLTGIREMLVESDLAARDSDGV
jgi:hypothetical protein